MLVIYRQSNKHLTILYQTRVTFDTCFLQYYQSGRCDSYRNQNFFGSWTAAFIEQLLSCISAVFQLQGTLLNLDTVIVKKLQGSRQIHKGQSKVNLVSISSLKICQDAQITVNTANSWRPIEILPYSILRVDRRFDIFGVQTF